MAYKKCAGFFRATLYTTTTVISTLTWSRVARSAASVLSLRASSTSARALDSSASERRRSAVSASTWRSVRPCVGWSPTAPSLNSYELSPPDTQQINAQIRKLLEFFSPTSTTPQALNIVLSKVWLQRRIIWVKCVEEGDHISPFGRLFITAEIEMWIL